MAGKPDDLRSAMPLPLATTAAAFATATPFFSSLAPTSVLASEKCMYLGCPDLVRVTITALEAVIRSLMRPFSPCLSPSSRRSENISM